MAFTTPPAQPQPIRSETFIPWADSYVAWQAQYVGEMTEYQGALTAIASGAAQSIAYTVSSTTTDADPTDGFLRFSDFADQSAATTLRLGLVDAGGATQTAVIDTFDDSTSAVKGFIRLIKLNDPTKWITFSVSALASPSGYRNVTVAHVAGSSAAPFANNDSIILQFARTGDKGETAAAAGLPRSERTSNTILAAADSGTLIDVTSGTFTQTFSAAATLGAQWWCFFRNSGTGDITLDPNGAETIDGLSSFIMYPGECRLMQCNGTNLKTAVLTAFTKTFTASGTFPKPPGYSTLGGLVFGGGASGAKTNGKIGGSGGGGCVAFSLPASSFAATETITVAAVATGPSTNGPGVAGGNSSIGTLVTAYGGGAAGTHTTGSGGGGGGAISAGQAGQVGTTSNGGGPILASGVGNTGFGGAGGPSGAAGTDAFYGGGAGGGCNGDFKGGDSVYGGGGSAGIDITPAAAGTSKFAGNAGASSAASSGGDGVAPSGAGGSTKTGAKAGDGARGEVRIWGIA